MSQAPKFSHDGKKWPDHTMDITASDMKEGMT